MLENVSRRIMKGELADLVEIVQRGLEMAQKLFKINNN
jgi:hypothetical protein